MWVRIGFARRFLARIDSKLERVFEVSQNVRDNLRDFKEDFKDLKADFREFKIDIKSMRKEVKELMATVAELQAEVSRLTTEAARLAQASADEKVEVTGKLGNLNLSITDLKKQIEDLQTGSTIDQATFDALKAGVDSVASSADAVSGIFIETT